ncbi:MAG: hypothetical protein ABSD59_08215 [Terracidiphilus sp.]
MIEQVKNWLNEQGYPLEMRTASALRKVGFEVTQSALYTDQETGKAREIDVLAVYPDYVGVTRIAFFVECKSLKKPWVLLCNPEVFSGHHRVYSFAAVNKNAVEAMVAEPVFKAFMDGCPWFCKDKLTGYGLRGAFTDKDIAYDATIGFAKASIDFVNNSKDYQQSLAFPIIVITGPLIRCVLDKDGEIQLEEVTQGEVYFKCDLAGQFGVCVKIVTLEGLPDFAREAWQVAGFVRSQLGEAEAKLWEKEFASPYPAELKCLVDKEHQRASGETKDGASPTHSK